MKRIFYLVFFISILVDFSSADYSFYFQPPNEASEEKAFEKLRIFEEKFQQGVEDLVRKIVPTVVNLGYEANISRECSSSLMKLLLDFKDMKTWAFLMLDATGKQEGGFMSGTLGSLGNYKQCLDIVEGMDDRVIRGKYCLVDVKPPLPPKPKQLAMKQPILISPNSTFKTQLMGEVAPWLFAFYDLSIRFGVCVPSRCSKEDLNELLNKLLEPFKLNTGVISCEVKEKSNLDSLQYAIIAILLIIFGVNLLCTATYFVKLKERNSDNKKISTSLKVLRAFSIPENFQKSVNTSRRIDTTLDFLDGVRFLSMTWVVLGHAYCVLNHYLLRNLMGIDAIVSDILFEAIGSGFLAVDTFIFIGGTVMAYGVIKQIGKRGLGAKEALILTLCRIWRILPCLCLLIGLTLLMPLIGSGPMWKDYTEGIANNCRKSWWANLLFINNYYNNLYDMCLSHTWYMSVDFQCFIFGIIYLLIYFKCPRVSKVYVATLIIICTSLTGFITYYFEYPPTILIKKSIFLDYRYGVQYMALSYISTHVHLGVYCIGLLTGTYIAKSQKPHIGFITARFGWCISVIAGLSIVYGIHHWNEDVPYTQFEAILYSSLQRLVWAAVLCWVCFACLSGNGGIVHTFLAWSGFRPLAQLSFLVYLIHYIIIIGYVASGQGLSDYTHSRFVFIFFGLLCVSHILAFFLNVLIESPLIQVTKIIYQDMLGYKIQPIKPQLANGTLSNGNVTNGHANGKVMNGNRYPINGTVIQETKKASIVDDFESDQSGLQITRF